MSFLPPPRLVGVVYSLCEQRLLNSVSFAHSLLQWGGHFFILYFSMVCSARSKICGRMSLLFTK